MRCTNKLLYLGIGTVLSAMLLTGCGNLKYSFGYDPNYAVSSFRIMNTESDSTAKPFAQDLCVVSDNIQTEEVDMSRAAAACLFDVNTTNVLYSKNAHERLNPASLTKIMTALVAVKNGSLDQVLTASNQVNISESGAQVCGLKPGDSMTLAQALHILLIYSANDVAMLIAENIGGTPENFMQMMNEEAKAIGATNSNFTNPHGLTEESHYTTAYDLYLIFNEALKYETITQIINMNSYSTTYTNAKGEAKELSFETTNMYLRGKYPTPENVTIIGGKTGTTDAAGHCLTLLSKDAGGKPYISVILRAEERDVLYTEMTDLLDEINK